MATSIDDLVLDIPIAVEESEAAQEQQQFLNENFTRIQAYVKELEARIVVLEALHP